MRLKSSFSFLLVLFFTFCFTPINGLAQSRATTGQEVKELMSLFIKGKDKGKQLQLAKAAEAIVDKESNNKVKARNYRLIGFNLNKISAYDEAYDMLQKARSSYDKIEEGDNDVLYLSILNQLISVEFNRSKFDKVKELFNQIEYPIGASQAAVTVLSQRRRMAMIDGDDKEQLTLLYEILARSEGGESSYFKLTHITSLTYLITEKILAQELDSAKFYLSKAKLRLPNAPQEPKLILKVISSEIEIGFKEKNLDEVERKLTEGDQILNGLNKNELWIGHLNRWLRYIKLMVIRQGKSQFLVTQAQEKITLLKPYLENARLESKLKALNRIHDLYEVLELWKKANLTLNELYDLEKNVFQERVAQGFNRERELLAESTLAKAELQQVTIDLGNKQLKDANLRQLILLIAISIVLILIYFIYRNSIERKRHNLLLVKQKRQIEKMDELKNKFFVNISHELRTPLTLILGNTQNSINGKFGEIGDKQRGALKNIESNSRRILSLVQDMLDLSKLESGKQELRIRQLSLKDKVQSVISLFDYQLSSKAIEVKEEGFTEETKAYLDPFKFETILFNLLGNAIKFSFNHSTISIKLEQMSEAFLLSIGNQGDPIPESDLPFLFDHFFQSGNNDSGEGTGVGLALTRELVELHQGEITVSNEPNGYTFFTLRFKQGIAHFDESIIQDENELTFDLEHGSKSVGLSTVLIVEDNPEMMAHTKDLLQEDFVVYVASTGKEALEVLKEVTPDLIITDFMMPEMNGVELFRAVKSMEHISSIPFIFLTARLIEEERDNLLLEGVSDYIIKPFETKDLKRRVHALLNLKAERDSVFNEIDRNNTDFDFVKRLRGQVIEQIAETTLSPAVLAECFSVSERTLYRKIKESTGFTPQGYVREVRMQEARRLITANNNLSVAEVAYSLGFADPGYFSKNYKRRFGISPSKRA